MLAIGQDLHIHTYLSACCHEKEQMTPRAILERAARMGVGTVGFADHLWVNPDLPPSGWYKPQDETQTARLRADLAALAIPASVRVLVGCEAEMIAPGKYGLTPDYARTLDFVLLACSHFHMKNFVEQPAGQEPRDIARHLLRFFIAGVNSGLATAIAHPFMPVGGTDRLDAIIATISDAEFLDAFGQAADRKVGIEVTTGFLPVPPKPSFSMETPVRFLTLAKQAGCRFTFASDAHTAEAQERLPELIRLVDAVGITPHDLLAI